MNRSMSSILKSRLPVPSNGSLAPALFTLLEIMEDREEAAQARISAARAIGQTIAEQPLSAVRSYGIFARRA